MKYCSKCGNQLFDEAVICPACGCPAGDAPFSEAPQQNTEDKVSVGLCILAALIPLFGFIYWPVRYRFTPKKAKACGITAIVSWVVSFVFMMSMGL